MDGDILLYIQEFIRNDILDPVMIVITHTGDYGILCIAAAFLLILIPKTRIVGHITAVSIAIEFIINNICLKNIIARTRPYEVIEELEILIGAQPDYSFPSGHSGVTFAFAGAMLFAMMLGVPELSENRNYKIATGFVMLYAVLLAFSRLYVGVHYPTDVLAGMLLGLATGLAGYHIEKKMRKTWENREKDKWKRTETKEQTP